MPLGSAEPLPTDRRRLRRLMRARRRALSAAQRARYARALSRRLAAQPVLLRSQRLALYHAADGEMSLAPLWQRLRRSRKRCFLPVLQPRRNLLWFRGYDAATRLHPNRFGIPEPPPSQPRQPPWALDLVLMPLVAFDNQGNRLGMGGGFYDRCFAYLRRRRHWRKPRLLGIAYEFQRVEQLPAQAWDVPLWGVATERGLYRFKRG